MILLVYGTENNHIANVEELQQFIDSNIANSRALQVSMTTTELANSPDATPIKDISSNYEYVWKPQDETGMQSM